MIFKTPPFVWIFQLRVVTLSLLLLACDGSSLQQFIVLLAFDQPIWQLVLGPTEVPAIWIKTFLIKHSPRMIDDKVNIIRFVRRPLAKAETIVGQSKAPY